MCLIVGYFVAHLVGKVAEAAVGDAGASAVEVVDQGTTVDFLAIAAS